MFGTFTRCLIPHGINQKRGPLLCVFSLCWFTEANTFHFSGNNKLIYRDFNVPTIHTVLFAFWFKITAQREAFNEFAWV